MNATLLFFVVALSVLPLIAGECPDPSGSVHGQVVNRTHHLITLCWDPPSTTAIQSFQVNVRCQRGEETLELGSHRSRHQEVNLTLECGYLCNASLTTYTSFGSHPETPLPSFSTIDTLTPIVRSAAIAPNDSVSVTVESREGFPLSCGAPQSVGLKWPQLEHAIVYSNWTWNNGNVVLSLRNVTYCDLPLNMSVYYTPYWSTHVYTSEEPGTVIPKPLEAPNISGVVVQDSVLTVVFADKAVICSNSSWEVCVTVDGRDETEHCSSQSAEDRLMTVDGGKGNVYRVTARVLYGGWHSLYSETPSFNAASVLPRDQLTLSNIGLPDVQLCYELNLLSLKKVSTLAQPKHFVVHYKLCGSVDERSSNLSVNGTCQDLHGWLGGHCYEVQLFLTLDIDGLEISLNASFQAVNEGEVREGPTLPLISLAAIPVFIVLGCLLFVVWAKQSRYAKSICQAKQPEMPTGDFEFEPSIDGGSVTDPDTKCSDIESESSEEDCNCRGYVLDTEDHDQPNGDLEHRHDFVQGCSCDYVVVSLSSYTSDCSSLSSVGSENAVQNSETPLMSTIGNGE